MKLEKVTEIPAGLTLTPWSQKEFEMTDEAARRALESVSPHIWVSYGAAGEKIAVGGIMEHVSAPPEFWLLICNEFREHLRRNLAILKLHSEYVFSLYPRLLVRVDAECPVGQRFSEYMGFTFMRERQQRHGRDYMVFEVSK